jgi:hypothetical protein
MDTIYIMNIVVVSHGDFTWYNGAFHEESIIYRKYYNYQLWAQSTLLVVFGKYKDVRARFLIPVLVAR